MQAVGQIPHTLDEALAQITEILARGYMRYEKSRRLATESGGPVPNAKQVEDSGLCTPLLQKSEGSRAPR
jgi:hypothetical protein